MAIRDRVSFQELSLAANAIWPNPVATNIANETMNILNIAYHRKSRFFNGKCSRGLIAGIFYLLGYRYDSVRKQKEIAVRLKTNEVTTRNSYRQWLTEFSDLFADVIAKFSTDKSLRYFILCDFQKQAINQKGR